MAATGECHAQPEHPYRQLLRFSCLKSLWATIQKDDCLGLASEMAFTLIMSLIPTLVFFLSLFGLLGQDQGGVSGVLGPVQQFIPPQIMGLLSQLIKEIIKGSSEGLAIVGILAALWSASNGLAVVIKGLNRAYGIEKQTRQRGFILQKMGAIATLLVIWFGMLIGAQFLAFGNLIVEGAETLLQVPQIGFINYLIGRWLIPITVLSVFAGILYYIIPKIEGIHLKLRMIMPGIVLFSITWTAMSILFSYYLDFIPQTNYLYGVLGGVLALMFWLYLSCFVLLVGGEINSLFIRVNEVPYEELHPNAKEPQMDKATEESQKTGKKVG